MWRPRIRTRPGALKRCRKSSSVTSQGLELTIRGRGDNLITAVIHCLADHQIRVLDFRTELPTLEDVFLKLTGHAIRT